MKTILKKLSLLLLILATISCDKDNEKASPTNTATYINFSVAGNSKNGTFNINDDDNNSNQNIIGLIAGEFASVEFLDGTQSMSARFEVPAATGITEITDTNPYGHNVGFGFEDIYLEDKAISVHITEIEFDNMLLLHIKGTFTGTAIHNTHDPNSGEEIEIPHLVDGEFEYTNPLY